MIGRLLVVTAAFSAAVLSANPAFASSKVLKHDKYAEDINTAVASMNGQTLQVEPGFVQGEAFGVLFRPAQADYPFKLDGVDLVFAGPQGDPNFSDSTTLTVEVYLNAGAGPQPAKLTPDYSIASSEFYNSATGDFGVPIKGNAAYQFTFDPSDPEGAPPEVTEGTILVMVRFTKPGKDYKDTGWSILECAAELAGFDVGCGCQPVGMILDGTPSAKSLTPSANIMNIVWPVGDCAGNKAWKWFEDITIGTKKLNGDVIMRLRIDSSDTACIGDCTVKACGDDGCGNPCGVCEGGQSCTGAGACCTQQCDGKVCGPDGCGGVCGNCAAGLVCDTGLCKQPCVPNCANRECGPDGCGGTCGVGPCTAGTTCETATGLCVTACTPDCAGKACGPDGCGGTCGICGDNQLCTNEWACVTVDGCKPACTGKGCGDDGCGGTCGACPDGEACDAAGQCQSIDGSDGTDANDGTPGTDATDATDGAMPAPELTLLSISPDEAVFGVETAVTITGTGFSEGVLLKLGGVSLLGVTVESPSVISATVPNTLAADTYDLIVFSKSGDTDTLRRAFTVKATGAAASGCSSTSGGASLSGLGGLALLLASCAALSFARRRRPTLRPVRLRRDVRITKS